MDRDTLLLAKAILFLFALITFIAYNFWELHRDSKKSPPEEPSGHVSRPEDDERDDDDRSA